MREAKELATCLTINRRLRGEDYPFEAVVKFSGDMDVNEHNDVWRKYTRNMKRKGITALWTREPTQKNHVHYHLIVSAPGAIQAARDALTAACPTGYHDRLRLHLERIKFQTATINYVVKAKVADEHTADKYQHKRLWFAPHVKLDKYGSIGPFWVKPRVQIWQGVIERERGIGEYRTAVHKDAVRLSDLTGEPLHRVERSLAYFAWKAGGKLS